MIWVGNIKNSIQPITIDIGSVNSFAYDLQSIQYVQIASCCSVLIDPVNVKLVGSRGNVDGVRAGKFICFLYSTPKGTEGQDKRRENYQIGNTESVACIQVTNVLIGVNSKLRCNRRRRLAEEKYELYTDAGDYFLNFLTCSHAVCSYGNVKHENVEGASGRKCCPATVTT